MLRNPSTEGRPHTRAEASNYPRRMATETEDQDQAVETEIDATQAEKLLAEGAQIVDVRQDYEWEAGHIDGALHIPLEQLPSRADEVDRGRTVVFSCRSGSRSSFATSAFREAGFEAFNLAGGLEAWVEAGKPIEPADGEVAGPLPDGR
jgi:rhodanese-related sulfurtransferase